MSTFKLLLVLSLTLLASCAKDPSVITVGSKNFSENILLAELIAQQIETRTDLTVVRRLNLGGSFLCHEAMLVGEIDIYPEYTGTALMAILKLPVDQDAASVLDTASQAYREKFQVEWMPPFGFNNTFAIVVGGAKAAQSDLSTITELAAVSPGLTIGFGFEFLERQDGYPGMVSAYGLTFAREPMTMDMGLVYRALGDGKIDVGVGNSTDGLIAAFELRVLEDDKKFFPPYDAAAIVRAEVLAANPALRDVLGELGGLLSEEEMRILNHQVDGEHRPVAKVVEELRLKKGLRGRR
jgi:osmoprotectant transport system substrate-binding protein